MVRENSNKISLYDEARASFRSLLQQTATVFIGFVVMLLLTGGAPSGFIVALTVGLGTAFVAWSEQKRVINQRAIEPEKSTSEELRHLLHKISRNPRQKKTLGNQFKPPISEGKSLTSESVRRKIPNPRHNPRTISVTLSGTRVIAHKHFLNPDTNISVTSKSLSSTVDINNPKLKKNGTSHIPPTPFKGCHYYVIYDYLPLGKNRLVKIRKSR